MQPFSEKIRQLGAPLTRRGVDALQVNLGRYCNLACIHCHVESGPTRTEMMSRETVDAVLGFLAGAAIPTLDITGGAPELHPDFDHIVESAARLGRHGKLAPAIPAAERNEHGSGGYERRRRARHTGEP